MKDTLGALDALNSHIPRRAGGETLPKLDK